MFFNGKFSVLISFKHCLVEINVFVIYSYANKVLATIDILIYLGFLMIERYKKKMNLKFEYLIIESQLYKVIWC